MDLDRRRRRRARRAVLAGALTSAICAHAQPAAERSLAPITVTVQPGVAQRVFDTPASVDVIDGAVLREGQLQVNVSEALARVPGIVGLNRQNYAQDLQISSRGFGARSTFGVRGIRLYVDGIPATGPDGQGQVSHFDLPSAARLEVLRGPFSALYGNASGGVISLFTEDGGPDTVVHGASAFGSDGVQRHNLRLSGQSGSVRFHVGTTHFETDGWREHSAASRDTFNGKLRWDAGEGTSLTLVGNSVAMPDVQDPLGLTRAELEADPRRATPVALAFDTRKTVRQEQLGLVLAHRLDAGDRVQVTGWHGERSTRQFQSIPPAAQAAPTSPGGVIDLGRAYEGVDARWIRQSRWGGTPLTLTAGAALEQVREDRRGFQNFVGATLGVQGALRRDEGNRARSFDQYVQAEWEMNERWSLSAGLRHSSVAMRSRDRYIVPGNGDDSGSVRYSAFTPAAGVVYHWRDDVNLYAAAGRGFETPTLNELSYRPGGAPGLNFALQPATSRQWEAGVKVQREAWRMQAAYFEARTADELTVLANTGGRSVFQNAASTRRRGVELSGQATWGGGWSTQLAASAIDARYRAGPGIPAGNRMPGIPAHSLFAELAWAHQPWGLVTALEWRRLGRIQVDDANSDSAAPSSVLALRASLAQVVGRWSFSEFVRIDNLTDRAYAGSVIVNEGNRRFFEPAPGRTWLVGVNGSYRF